MKFLTKINRNYLFLFSTILLAISITGYFVLKTIILQNTKENLISQETHIEKQISATGIIPDLKPYIEISKLNTRSLSHQAFSEISVFNSDENEAELYIEYSNTIKINNTFYSIKIREASVENADLAASIAASIFILLLSSFTISYTITKRLNKTTWKVFEQNLKTIEDFDFRENKSLQLLPSGIDEFDRLNTVVNNLTTKLKNDFVTLKEFTENASHEIQTPLSIASVNLEEILQQKLTEESFRRIVTAINAIKRLSALNQNLLLLAKIENNQFSATDKIQFNDLIKIKIDEFEPILRERNNQVSLTFQSIFSVKMNLHLAEILLNNLLSNAVNHNVGNGHINIYVDQEKLTISNTGLNKALDNRTIFNRFVKGNSASHGLGLAIVKQICDSHHLQIHYTYSELHCFTIIHEK